ncbi:MAG: hypothetical protein R3F43_11785 [bacterium]
MTTLARRAAAFLDDQRPPTPSLVLDLDVVAARYALVADAVPGGRVWYAVKANPTPALLERLHTLGSAFDIASFGELTACLAAGARGADLSFGNTAKRPEDIRRARAAGVELFVFDAPSELEKLAAHAPGASVFCRLAVEADGAAWPLMTTPSVAEARRPRTQGHPQGLARREGAGSPRSADRTSGKGDSPTSRSKAWQPSAPRLTASTPRRAR